MRLKKRGKPVERITIGITVFDNGEWGWKARQRYQKTPYLKVDDILTILDEVKKEIIAVEEASQTEKKPDTVEPRALGRK